jgi:hypothetical protein
MKGSFRVRVCASHIASRREPHHFNVGEAGEDEALQKLATDAACPNHQHAVPRRAVSLQGAR